MDKLYKQFFPNLSDVANKKTSEADSQYNCIAWAFKENHRVWWPASNRTYWPIPVHNLTKLQAFEAWFAADGWEETDNPNVEQGYEKIALFALSGEPTHAARLLPSGLWTSKLGWHPKLGIDLSHGLTDLDGPSYGSVTKMYRKQVTSAPSA